MRMALLRIAEDAHYFVWSHHHLLLDGGACSCSPSKIIEQYESALPPSRAVPASRSVPRLHRLAACGRTRTLPNASGRTSCALYAPNPDRWGAGSALADGDERAHAEAWIELTNDEQTQISNMPTAARDAQHRSAGRVVAAAECPYRRGSVVFGATVSGRPPELEGAEEMVGLFVNVQPVRVRVDAEQAVPAWLRSLQLRSAEARSYEHVSLSSIQGWSEVERGTPPSRASYREELSARNGAASAGETLRVEACRTSSGRTIRCASFAAVGKNSSSCSHLQRTGASRATQ